MSVSVSQYQEMLGTYLKPHRLAVALLSLLLLASIGLQVVAPQAVRTYIDTAQSDAPIEALTIAAAAYLGSTLLAQALAVGATYLGESVAWRTTNALRFDLARHCLDLDMSFHTTLTPGEMIERIDSDVSALAGFFSQFVVRVSGNGLMLAGVLVALLIEDWRVGLALTLLSCATLAIWLRASPTFISYWKDVSVTNAELYGFLEERLAGTEDIRASGAILHTVRHMIEITRRCVPTWRMAVLTSDAAGILSTLLIGASQVLVLGLGASRFLAGATTIGSVYLLFHYTSTLVRPLMGIAQQLASFQRAGAGTSRIQELFQMRCRLQDGAAAALPPGAPLVEFENVTFRYGEGETVLHDVSFRLEPGRVLGLLGRTGSGKTTIARLLLRLYDPLQGTVRIGGVDVRAARLADLRQHAGMVTQEVYTFDGTVRDNLTYFDDRIPDEQLLGVLQEVGLRAWVDALPRGLDTRLAPGGGDLSAGEAQLLAFARIFMQDARLVILDEASSRLDPATEQLIERALTRLLRGRSAIIIAHRLGTVRRADDVLILEQGRVEEYGERERLAGDPTSRLAALLRTGMEEVLA